MTLHSHILVDASVARSVGEPPSDEVSAACLRLVRVLEQRDCATGIAITPALQREWHRHAPRMVAAWLARMESTHRIRRAPDKPVRDLRKALACVSDAGKRVAIEKDLHLSEAAILLNLPVASRDERQRRYLGELAPTYAAAGRVQWMNPAKNDEPEWTEWIMRGCTDQVVYRTA